MTMTMTMMMMTMTMTHHQVDDDVEYDDDRYIKHIDSQTDRQDKYSFVVEVL